MSSRRAILLGSAGVGVLGALGLAGLLAERGVIPGKAALDEHLGRCDASVPPIPPATVAGTEIAGTFASTRRSRRVSYRIAYPPGHQAGGRLPVAIALHGFGSDPTGEIDGVRYQDYLAAAVNAGTPPFAIAAPDGGNGYWHPQGGDDPLGMIFDEFLPLLGDRGLKVARPAVIGTSMGGFGAILCGLTAPGRFVTVVASSPAFWRSYAEARNVNAGSFASAADWRSYGDLMSRASQLDKLPLHIYVGRADPFEPAIAALRGRLADPSVVKMSTGCHDGRLWQHFAPEQMRLIGTALAS